MLLRAFARKGRGTVTGLTPGSTRVAWRLPLSAILLLLSFAEWPETVSAGELVAYAGRSVDSCIVEMTGDVNESGSITAADVIYLINWILLDGPAPKPCVGAGDVNCTGLINSADVVYLINYTFKSGLVPCSICQAENPLGCVR